MSVEYGSDLHLAKLTPEFIKFQAILGWRIKDTVQWAPFARLRDLHGWPRLIRACEQADPGDRWASTLEKLCNIYAKQSLDASLEASNRERMGKVVPTNNSERAALFSQLLTKHGLKP